MDRCKWSEQHEKIEPIFSIGHKHSTGNGKRNIFTPDEIMRFPLDKELIIFRGKDVMMAQKYDFSLHLEAKRFRTISIQDRPDINDINGRALYKKQDEAYIQAYLDKINSTKDETAESVYNSLKNKDMNSNKKNTSKSNETVNESVDIELQTEDYIEFDTEKVSVNEITFVDDEAVIKNDNSICNIEIVDSNDINIEENSDLEYSPKIEDNFPIYECPTDYGLPDDKEIDRVCPKAPEIKPKNKGFKYTQ